jgi:hypothetical protein
MSFSSRERCLTSSSPAKVKGILIFPAGPDPATDDRVDSGIY